MKSIPTTPTETTEMDAYTTMLRLRVEELEALIAQLRATPGLATACGDAQAIRRLRRQVREYKAILAAEAR